MEKYEEVLGPATSLSHLKPTEGCVVIRDQTGQLFVRSVIDEDVLSLARRYGT